MRKEKDTMGEVPVPDGSYYGAQTQRAIDNFKISGLLMPDSIIDAIAIIKRSAAIVNNSTGSLDVKTKDAIVEAADEIIKGKLRDQFPVDVFQTGSGTSTNMNVNEVISNRANELLGGSLGDKHPVHPNDHVNMGQSSNDVIPTAIHIAARISIEELLVPSLKNLEIEIKKKVEEFSQIIKIGRTHLQDATPITLGQEFSGYQQMIRNSIHRVNQSKKYISQLAQGGTAVGTGINTHKDFGKSMAIEISNYTGLDFSEAENHFEAQSSQDACIELSGVLKTISVSMHKISNDIRWLGSGPRCGLGELKIPPVQPGSSIMPGKVNPVICESVIQVCAQVVGNDTAITLGGRGGYFELNLMLPLLGYNLMQSIQILSNAINTFSSLLLANLDADEEVCNNFIENSLALCTPLVPEIGYDKSAEVAYTAYKERKTIRQVLKDKKILSNEKIDSILDFKKMI